MERVFVGKRKAITNWMRQFRTFIDFDKKMFKIQEGFLGIFKWGDFEPLPKIDYVLIFRTFFVKCEVCTADDLLDNPNSYYQVSMVYRKNRRIIVHETKKRDEAFSVAYDVAKGLNTRLMDSATDRRQGKWVLIP